MQGLFVVFCPQKYHFFLRISTLFPLKIHLYLTIERVLGDDEERQLHADETVNIVRAVIKR